jgi:nicotinamidase-related amidase
MGMVKLLIVVDVQYDFCNPNGALYVKGGENIKDNILKIIPDFDYVIFTNDTHPINHCSFISNGGSWPTHCVVNSIGEGIPVELLISAKDYSIECKGGNPDEEEYGAFSSVLDFYSQLIWAFDYLEPYDADLKSTDSIVICGIAGDYCVLETLKNILNMFPSDVIKIYNDGIASIDGGIKLQNFCKEHNIKEYKHDNS